MSFTEDTKKRLVIALTDESAADEVESEINSAAQSGGGISNGTVVIGLVAEDGVDYVFTGTASYAAAAADPKVAKGGVIVFQAGTYVFDTNPSWHPAIHIGQGTSKTYLELPAAQTSTGSDIDGQYEFRSMTLTTPGGGAPGFAGSGTHQINWTDNMRSVLRDAVTDFDLRWQPKHGNFPHIIENCSLGYNGAPTEFDWSDAVVSVIYSWSASHPIKANAQTAINWRGGDSVTIEMQGASDNGQMNFFAGINGLNLNKASTGNMTNVRVMGCSSNGTPPTGFSGHFVGNEITDIRGLVV